MNYADKMIPVTIAGSVANGVDGGAVLSSAIDCQAANRVMLVITIGAAATDGGKITYHIEECATSGGTYAVIKEVVKTFGASGETGKTHMLEVPITKRYVKVQYQRETENSAVHLIQLFIVDTKMKPTEVSNDLKARLIL
jgi:hypothetical protein